MKLLIILTIAAGALGAHALTLKEKKQFEEWKTQLKEPYVSSGKSIKDLCGADIPATLDESMVTPFMTENTNAASFCREIYSALSSMCGDATAKAEISKKIKKISCKLGKDNEVTYKLNGNELVMTVGVKANNISTKTTKFIEDNL